MAEKAHSLVQPEHMGELFSLNDYARNKEIGRGIMRTRGSQDEIWLPITPANEVFFVRRNDSITPELISQGSGLIASLLVGLREHELSKPIDSLQPLAMYDTTGKFYDRYVLTDIVEEMQDINGITKKHHATFESSYDKQLDQLKLEVDAIRCISNAIKP